MLLLHNSFDLFEELANKADGSKCAVKPLYTGQRGSNKRFEGWKKEGLEHYNQICENVLEDRGTEFGDEMEQAFLDYMKAKKAMVERSGK